MKKQSTNEVRISAFYDEGLNLSYDDDKDHCYCRQRSLSLSERDRDAPPTPASSFVQESILEKEMFRPQVTGVVVISQSDMQCSTMFSIESTILREGVNKCHLLGECAYYLLLDNYLFSYCHPLYWVIQGLPSSRYSITVITWYSFKDDKNLLLVKQIASNIVKHCLVHD